MKKIILDLTVILHGLIYVYRLPVHPVVSMGRKPLSEDMKKRLDLHLIQTNVFRSGMVPLIYRC